MNCNSLSWSSKTVSKSSKILSEHACYPQFILLSQYLPISLSDQLTRAAADSQRHISTHETILNDLEELGDMMSQMLERQHIVEVRINRSAALTPSSFTATPIPAAGRAPVAPLL